VDNLDLLTSGQPVLIKRFEKSEDTLDTEKLLMVLAGRVWFNDIELEIVPFEYSINAARFPKSTVLTLFSEKASICAVEL